MLEKLSKFPNTFKEFQKYLYENLYKKNNAAYSKFGNLPEDIYLWAFISFLEYKSRPLTEAFSFYNYDYPNAPFKDKFKNLILKEFELLEINKQETYIPF